MHKSVCFCSLLTAILAIAGCHRSTADQSTEAGRARSAAPSAADGNSPAKESDYVEFAKRLESFVDEGNAGQLKTLIDWSEFVDRTFTGIPLRKDEKELYARIWRDSNFFLGAVAKVVAGGGTYHFLRIKPDGHRRLAVFRLLSAGGVNYHELQLTESAAARFTSATSTSTPVGVGCRTLRRSMLLEEGLQKPEWQAAVNAQEKEFIQCTARLKALEKDVEEGQFQSALDVYGSLPPDLRQSLPLLLVRMVAAAGQPGRMPGRVRRTEAVFSHEPGGRPEVDRLLFHRQAIRAEPRRGTARSTDEWRLLLAGADRHFLPRRERPGSGRRTCR